MRLRTIIVATFVLAMSTPSFTQSAGTGAPERGKTGWTGGASEQPLSQEEKDRRAAADQPWMATGLDLKGPARQFPPTKTPE